MSGWDDFEELQSLSLPNETATELVDKLFVDALGTPAGRKLLAYWKKQYLDQPCCVPTVTNITAEWGCFREGQNNLIRDALNRLIRGTEPKL